MLQRVLHGVDGLHSRTVGSNPDLRLGAIISVSVHLVILLVLLIGLPFARPPEEPEETAVSMVFDGPLKALSMRRRRRRFLRPHQRLTSCRHRRHSSRPSRSRSS